jgi:hypothetical protein
LGLPGGLAFLVTACSFHYFQHRLIKFPTPVVTSIFIYLHKIKKKWLNFDSDLNMTCGRNCMVVGFTTSVYLCISPLRLWVRILKYCWKWHNIPKTHWHWFWNKSCIQIKTIYELQIDKYSQPLIKTIAFISY